MKATLNPFEGNQTELVPIGAAYSVTLGKMLDAGKTVDASHKVLPYIRAANIQDGGLRLEDVNEMPFSEDEAARLDLRRGDLLVVEGGAVGTTTVLDHDMPDWSFQKTVNRVRPYSDWSTRYLGYVLRAYRDAGVINLVCNGSTIPHLTAEKLRALRIPSASPDKQRAMADYLDRETARIDTLLEEQQRLIEVLRERREVIIDAELAKRGVRAPSSLDGDARYEVPHGWQVVLLGRALRQLTNGFVGPTRDILVDEGIRYIQSTHIKAGRIDFERRPFYVSREWHDERPRIHLQSGDVLIVQTGDIGKIAVVPPGFGEASCHALQIARVHPDLLSGEYLATFLSSRIGYHSLLVRATGALHPHLEAGIRAVPIVVPPHPVQAEIVEESSNQMAKIDTLIAETERFIELARERRAALITAAVTGQIDVRETA
ncbi:restriction endonuclease subunit S [Rhodococcus aetherivorans]